MATREQQRDYQRHWLLERRMEFFEGKACKKCGDTDRLELDHVDPESKVDHKIWSWSKRRREAEIAKCQVLCHPCHETKTTSGRHRKTVNEMAGFGMGPKPCTVNTSAAASPVGPLKH